MLGVFISTTQNNLGWGKLESVDNETATVVYFDSPSNAQAHRERVPINTLRKIHVPNETRAYVYDTNALIWRCGRIHGKGNSGYWIRFPNRIDLEIPESEIQVRWNKPIEDPTDILAYRLNDTAFFFDYRQPLVANMYAQRGGCHGMTGLLSATIDLVQHQVDAVNRVLQDPVQRYLLADEVGLGKTIEAGCVLRQYILDKPGDHYALIVTPPHLRFQWREELSDKMLLEPWLDHSIHIVSHDNLDAIRRHGERAGMLIIDEAHHLIRDPEIYKQLTLQAHQIPRLLLLSATPVLNNEQAFLAMLHLLDPHIYRLDEVDAFRQRVRDRQNIANLFHELQEETDNYFLEGVIESIQTCFKDDAYLSVQAKALQALLEEDVDEDDEERNRLIHRLRTHISETYRLHRRLIRNRRSAKGEISQLVPNRAGIRWIDYDDPIHADLEGLLDEWQVDALLWAGGNDARMLEMARDFQRLLEALGQSPSALAEQASTLTHRPRFPTEVQRLARLQTLARTHSDEVRLHALTEALKASDTPSVIFCSNANQADALFELLEKTFDKQCARHHNSDVHWRRFCTPGSGCRLLVCDEQAEEGLNLQGLGAEIIHLDLPFSPNRIEQRIGRLDRYSPGNPVQSVGLRPRASVYTRAWGRLLEEGIQVFSRSIASLQYSIEEEMLGLMSSIFLQGSAALAHSYTSSLRDKLQEELKAIQRMDALDAIEQERDEERLDWQIDEVDSSARAIQNAFEGWVVEALHFKKRESEPKRVWRYSFSRGHHPTLVPLDLFLDEFTNTLDLPNSDRQKPSTYPMTFRRSIAVGRPGVHLARIGNQFVDAMKTYLRWDDRGIAHAQWRYRPRHSLLRGEEVYLAFRFDFIVTADIRAAKALVQHYPQMTSEILQRRADAAFPPFAQTIWLDEQLSPITDEEWLTFLQQPYRSSGKMGQGRDYSIKAKRWEKISNRWSPSDWHALCLSARDMAIKQLNIHRALPERVEELLSRAKRRADEDATRFHSRLHHMDPQTRERERALLSAEEELNTEICRGVAEPHIRLDAIGAFFVARFDPFLGD